MQTMLLFIDAAYFILVAYSSKYMELVAILANWPANIVYICTFFYYNILENKTLKKCATRHMTIKKLLLY